MLGRFSRDASVEKSLEESPNAKYLNNRAIVNSASSEVLIIKIRILNMCANVANPNCLDPFAPAHVSLISCTSPIISSFVIVIVITLGSALELFPLGKSNTDSVTVPVV